jgi:RNA polymerase sigma-70 factor (ECF subfamily)
VIGELGHSAPDPAFERLLSAARSGDQSAWREIYAALAPGVLGYLRARRAEDPENLAGEVFLQVVRDLPGFEGPARGFRAWVFTIAHHRLLDERRREGRRGGHALTEPPEHAEPQGGDVEDEAMAGLALERVTRILASLSPDQRDVLLLRIVGDLSLEDVARVVGKRTGAVKQLQRRGLAAVRRQLEQARTRRR